MQQPETKLPDVLEYLQSMSESMMQMAAANNLTVLAHIFGQAALEAKQKLEAISGVQTGDGA
jgi:hypothetical protein